MAYPNDGEPKRLRILKDIRARMQGVTVANGYRTDVRGAEIFDSQRIQLNGPFPFISVIPLSDDTPASGASSCGVARDQLVDIVGAHQVTPQSAGWVDDAHWLLADIERAVFLDPQFSQEGGELLATTTTRTVSEVYDKGEQNLSLAHLQIRVSYRHKSDDPTN